VEVVVVEKRRRKRAAMVGESGEVARTSWSGGEEGVVGVDGTKRRISVVFWLVVGESGIDR